MAQISVSSEHSGSTATHVGPLALSSLALTTFFLGGLFVHMLTNAALIGFIFFFGGLVQLLVGMGEHRAGHTVHGTAFTVYGGLWLAFGAMLFYKGNPGIGDLGYFFLVWTVFAGITFLCTWHSSLAHIGVHPGFFLTFLALTIAAFAGGGIFMAIGGWLGIITAIIA